MQTRFKRHDLVEVSLEARRALFAGDEKAASWPALAARSVTEGVNGVRVPGVVRRQDAAEGSVSIGFAAPVRLGGARLRMAANVPQEALSLACGPFDAALLEPRAARRSLPAFQALRRVVELAHSQGAACGVFGSVALELLTGFLYCHDGSDLDVIFRCPLQEQLKALFDELLVVERETGVRVDGELQLGDGSAVKLKEFFSGSATVLAKGFEDVRLVARERAAALNDISEFKKS